MTRVTAGVSTPAAKASHVGEVETVDRLPCGVVTIDLVVKRRFSFHWNNGCGLDIDMSPALKAALRQAAWNARWAR